jgi:hypothetical protein
MRQLPRLSAASVMKRLCVGNEAAKSTSSRHLILYIEKRDEKLLAG